MDVIKIRRSDGLFSSGGYHPRFSAKGKTWRKLSDVRRHINEVGIAYRDSYNECVIVTYEFVLKNITEVNTADFLAAAAAKERALIEERRLRRVKAAEREEREEYDRLRAKFESMRGDPD